MTKLINFVINAVRAIVKYLNIRSVPEKNILFFFEGIEPINIITISKMKPKGFLNMVSHFAAVYTQTVCDVFHWNSFAVH